MEYGTKIDTGCYDYMIDQNYNRYVGWQEASCSCKELFSPHTIKLISSKITELTEGVDDKNRKIIIWGCGQDLTDLIPSIEKGNFTDHDKILLADRNPGKQGQIIQNIPIKDPEEHLKEPVDTVIIPSRSQLLRINIGEDAKSLFPKAKQIFPYGK